MKPDPLGIRGKQFDTLSSMGRVESTSATDAAREIDDALADAGLPATDDNLFRIAKELGYTVHEAKAAILAGVRAGLFEE